MLAQRQYEIGSFYATRENWTASIARLQTVADTYPLFSHSDLTLITLGDAYIQQAQMASRLNIPPSAKEQLVKVFNDRAATEWERVCTRYPMAPHVEDAKDRLIALGRPVPEPTQQQLAESEAEEGSRVNVKLKDRALLLVKHGPSTVEAARVGEPTLADPPPTLAPAVGKDTTAIYTAALKGAPMPGAAPSSTDAAAAAINNGTAPPRTDQPAAPLSLESVPNSTGGSNTVGAEIVGTGGNATNADTGNANPAAGNANPGAGNGNAAAPAPGTVSGDSSSVDRTVHVGATPAVNAVGPTNTQALPPIDKPAEAPNQINDVKGGGGAQVNTGTTANNKKNKKVPYNSSDESSSKHKKKKGLSKINPF